MWDPHWSAVVERHRAVRLDLRESASPPSGPPARSPITATSRPLSTKSGSVTPTSSACHSAPGSSPSWRSPGPTSSHRYYSSRRRRGPDRAVRRARGVLGGGRGRAEAGDLDAAVEANLRTWVDGPSTAGAGRSRGPGVRRGDAARCVRDHRWLGRSRRGVARPAAGARLGEVVQPTLVLVGDGDLPVVRQTAERVVADVPGARLVRWPVVAHLLSMERPADFTRLLLDWVRNGRSPGTEPPVG